jgi:hypothetical protein
MSTPEKAVYAQYGVKLGPSAADGVCRSFRIDEFRRGYLLKLPGAAAFGSVIDGECFIWEYGEWSPIEISEQNQGADIDYEWRIWRIAQAMIELGRKLSREDLERLALAVQRLESWL